jgi:agmatine/peptidylarginine deiminase
MDEVEPVFVAMATAIARFERVIVACHDDDVAARVKSLLSTLPPDRLTLAVTGSDDVWARDHGPITVDRDGALVPLDFIFNGWGGKFEADLDDAIPTRLSPWWTQDAEALNLVLEGGAIESDGRGTLITTSSVLCNPNRNPGLTRDAVDAALARHLGVTRIVYLEYGHLEGDDTDGHVDTIARLVDEHTIAYVACDERSDTHYASFAALEAELKKLLAFDGRPYRLVPLPWPKAVHDDDGRRLPATYANFLIINGAVLVPTYRDPADAEALRRLAAVFPGREVIGIDCKPLILQYGSLHCATMQLPAGTLREVHR